MDNDKETEEKKLRDLTPDKDAKGGSGIAEPLPVPLERPPGSRPTEPPLQQFSQNKTPKK
jgi:hypothetical protein